MTAASLSEQQLDEIRARLEHAREVAGRGNWPTSEYLTVRGALADMPVLLAAVDRLRVELTERTTFLTTVDADRERLADRVAELETERHGTKAELDSAVKVIVELHKLINSSGAAPTDGAR